MTRLTGCCCLVWHTKCWAVKKDDKSLLCVQKQNLVGNLLLHLLHKLSESRGQNSNYAGKFLFPEPEKVWHFVALAFDKSIRKNSSAPWCHNYLLARIMVIAVDITRYCFTPRWEPENYSKRLAVYFSSLGSVFQFQVMLQFLRTKVDFLAFQVFLKTQESFL